MVYTKLGLFIKRSQSSHLSQSSEWLPRNKRLKLYNMYYCVRRNLWPTKRLNLVFAINTRTRTNQNKHSTVAGFLLGETNNTLAENKDREEWHSPLQSFRWLQPRESQSQWFMTSGALHRLSSLNLPVSTIPFITCSSLQWDSLQNHIYLFWTCHLLTLFFYYRTLFR